MTIPANPVIPICSNQTQRARIASVALLAALAMNLNIPSLAAQISNGDFENPGATPSYVTIPTAANPAMVSWVVNNGTVDYGQSPAGTPCQIPNTHCIDLNGDTPATIEQTFDTMKGCVHRVDFFMSHHLQIASATMEVAIDGHPTVSFLHNTPVTQLDGQWEPRAFTFTAAGPSTVLTFKSTTNTTPSAAGPQIDNVSISNQCTGQLKVCKVAGPGVAVGTSFSFTAGSAPAFTVPAGTGPGGTCKVGPTFPQGSTITVTETPASGIQVAGITVAPVNRLVGTPNLSGGSVAVTIGSGITEVTFNNKQKGQESGFLEICKLANKGAPGSFTFYLNPGNLGPFVVPRGSCSPAIEVGAGMVTIQEVLSPGTQLVSCHTIPAMSQGPCNLAAGTSTVNVAPGDVSNQTIAFLTNRRTLSNDSNDSKN